MNGSPAVPIEPVTVTTIVCAHTEDRWSDILAAVASLQAQTRPPDEIIVAVDHNPRLAARLRSAFPIGCSIVENEGPRGVSGTRNAASHAATSDVLAFLDDDARAEPDWVESLAGWYAEPDVAGVGGHAEPDWDGGSPRWFPPEFHWVVGCTHVGVPTTPAPVRNFIGCNMSVRRSVWERVGGFDPGFGRLDGNGAGCDETEFCIRVRHQTAGRIMLDPRARISHRVPQHRRTVGYFLRRCLEEGRSKARLGAHSGSDDALSAERDYVRRVLPRAFAAGLRETSTLRDLAGVTRSIAIIAGLTATSFGFLEGRIRQRVR